MAQLLKYDHGNRCGHDKEFCREFVRDPEHKKPPYFISKAMDRVGDFYWYPLRYLRQLRYLTQNNVKKTERREAITAILQVLFNYTDLDTLCVCTWTKSGKLNNLRTAFIAEKAKCGIKRVSRALKDLELAGYIDIERKVLQGQFGLYQSNSITMMTSVFKDLGLKLKQLELSRHIKRKSNGIQCRTNRFRAYEPQKLDLIKDTRPSTESVLPKKVQELAKKATCWADCMNILPHLIPPS